jgi:hypothetical protein
MSKGMQESQGFAVGAFCMEKIHSEKKKTNWKLANYFAFGGIFLGLLLIVILGVSQLVYNSEFSNAKEALNSLFGIPTPFPTTDVSTITPSDTPSDIPSIQPSDTPTIQPSTVGKCDETYYVPQVSPMWVTTTEAKCEYAQKYAVDLWNRMHQQSRQLQPLPMPQYQAPQPVQYAEPNSQYAPPQYNYSAPPAIGAPPAVQAPQVQAPAPLPNVPAPPKNCYSYSVGAGAVTVPCQ